MTVAALDLRRIVAEMFRGMLGMQLDPLAGTPDMGGERTFTGCVQITGAWEGAVTIECGESLAREVAATMFGIDARSLSDEDLHDTVGELANIAGGNVKARLVGACVLSLPFVTSGRDYTVRLRDSTVIECVAHTTGQRAILASLLTRSAPLPRHVLPRTQGAPT